MAIVWNVELVRLLLSLFMLHFAYGDGSGKSFRRKVSLELNPGLNVSVSPVLNVNLLHVRAVGEKDTLHLLFSSQGAPALLLVHTDSTSSFVKVDWSNFLLSNLSGSLKVEPESSVRYSSALVFTRLWEYNDVNDTADPEKPPSSFFPPYELKNFSWGDLNGTLNHTAHTAELCGKGASENFHNGSFCLGLFAFESEGRGQRWPRLLHNANSSQLRFWLDGVTGRSNFSRFALEMQRVDGIKQPSRVDTLHFIDDEYTPSIFQVTQWVSSPSNTNSPILGYVQWKPVAYRTKVPVLADATPCHHSPPVSMKQLPPANLVLAYFGQGYETHGLNVTFSIAGDPFYNTTNYLSWTVLVGLGSPPSESFSPLVMAIMAVGLGIPLVLILLGGVGVCIRRWHCSPQGYTPIN